MIEILYQEDKREKNQEEATIHLPKNIRQIGENKGTKRIYVEDYVNTFLKRMSNTSEQRGHIAILLGRCRLKDGVSYLFVQGAVELQEAEISKEFLRFTDENWQYLQEQQDTFFKGQEILGWALSVTETNGDMRDEIKKNHIDYFSGNNKVLFMMDPVEKEESFYYYENGRLQKVDGYYIYYERNDPMQEYMMTQGDHRSIEETEQIPDHAVANFRKMLKRKNEPNVSTEEIPEEKPEEEKHMSKYGLVACMAVSVFVGAAFYARDTGLLSHMFVEKQQKTISSQGDALETATDAILAEGTELESDTVIPTNSFTNPMVTPTPSETEPSNTTVDSESQKENPSEEKVSVNTSAKEYIVKKGDTLSKISVSNYGDMSRIQEICELNHLENSELIFEGQKLILPQ